MTPAEKIKYAKAMRQQNCIALDDWHPWFAWYPVRPFKFVVCLSHTVKMYDGWPIWLRRCWRRRVCSGYHTASFWYEYRRWKRGNF